MADNPSKNQKETSYGCAFTPLRLDGKIRVDVGVLPLLLVSLAHLCYNYFEQNKKMGNDHSSRIDQAVDLVKQEIK